MGRPDPLDRLRAALADRDAVLILDNCEHLIDAAAALAARLLGDCPGGASSPPAASRSESAARPCTRRPAPGPARFAPGGWPEGLAGSYPAVRALRGPGRRCPARFHAQPRQRGRRGADLPGARRHAAGHRACGRPGSARWPPPSWRSGWRSRSPTASTTGSPCSPAGAGPRSPGTRRSARSSTGAGSCSQSPSGRSPAAWPSSPLAPRSPRRNRCCADPAPNETPRASVLRTLSGLVGKSIIAMSDTPGGCAPRSPDAGDGARLRSCAAAEAGEESATRDAFARYYRDFAETADPLLRAADQIRWFRELLAEQDNANAALRWAIGRATRPPRCGWSGRLATTSPSTPWWRWPSRCSCSSRGTASTPRTTTTATLRRATPGCGRWGSSTGRRTPASLAGWPAPRTTCARARLALVILAQGDERRCRDELAAALDACAAWTDHSTLAAVLDACACYAIHRQQGQRPGPPPGRARRPAARRGARRPRRLRRVKPRRPAGPRRRPRLAGRGRVRGGVPVHRRLDLRGIPRAGPRDLDGVIGGSGAGRVRSITEGL